MRIQRRITLGIGILFTMILLLGIQSVGYVRQLSRATGTILADNYNSLQYAGEMLRSLNDIGQDSISRHALRENLALQQQNITEISEKETTAALERHVASLSDPVTEAEIRTVREDLFRIMELNMAAIRAKSAGVEQRADYAMWWLIAVAALCALIAGGILVWFPQSVLRPIDALKKGITQIANHNYRERLDFPGNREFESVAESFNDMAAKLDEYRRSSLDDLMTAKKRIEAIVDTLHEPIVGLGPDRRILFMNREAFSVLNLREDAVGRDAAEVALSNDLLRRLVRGVNDTEKDADKEPLKIYADNKESYFQVENTPLYITPVGGREQQFVGNLIVLNNVTRFKELDSAKTNFISTVSHEMKTPISSILMSLQLLGDDRLGTLNGEQKQLVTSIKESSDRLLSITGELLNMTQIETGKLKLIPKVTKPIELIDYAVKATQVLAERFCCFVEVDYPEKISKLFVDNEKIAWVITNLLSNAIHHSPERSRIIVGAVQREKAVEIYVQDFGRGIPALPQEHLRALFPRPGNQGAGQRAGAGHLEGVRRSARRHDLGRERNRPRQPLLDSAPGLKNYPPPASETVRSAANRRNSLLRLRHQSGSCLDGGGKAAGHGAVRLGGKDHDRHTDVDILFHQFEQIAIVQPDAPFGCTRADRGGIVGSMDTDAAVTGRFQTDEMRTVGPSDLPLTVAKIVRPCACVLNLLDGEKPFGRLHITRLLLVAQRPPAGNGIDGPQAAVEIVNRKSHRLLADSNKCRTRKRRLLCTYVDGAEQRTCKKGT